MEQLSGSLSAFAGPSQNGLGIMQYHYAKLTQTLPYQAVGVYVTPVLVK